MNTNKLLVGRALPLGNRARRITSPPGAWVRGPWAALGIIALCVTAAPALGRAPDPLRAPHGAVASDHAAASQAGVSVLKQGGNAIDAACATALSLGVTVPHSSGIGGGGFAVIYIAAQNKTYTLDFRETAPAQLQPALFIKDGKPQKDLIRTGGLAVGVPGEVRGLGEMVGKWGKLPFSKCVDPALKLANHGVPASHEMKNVIEMIAANDPGIRMAFQYRGALSEGTLLKRPALAGTLNRLKKYGPEAFYRGDIAQDIVEAVREAGGVLTLQDLENYHPVQREALQTTFRGHTVYSMPPPSSGGVAITTALGILQAKSQDLRPLGHNSSAYLHLVVESLKHAFADRARHLGDTDFVQVPLQKLLAPRYHAQLADKIAKTVLPPGEYGTPGPNPDPPHDAGTAHLSVIDKDGNAVALTTTVNHWFGSKVLAEKSGVILNNQMDDFSIQPGVANGFALLGTENNAIAPGKRPLSSMSPTIVVGPQGVKMAVGGAGGPRIISGTLQVLLNVIEFSMDAQKASSAPRVHHQWMPNVLRYEDEIPVDVISALERRGHKTQEVDHVARVNVVVKTENGVEAASEFRAGGAPAGH